MIEALPNHIFKNYFIFSRYSNYSGRNFIQYNYRIKIFTTMIYQIYTRLSVFNINLFFNWRLITLQYFIGFAIHQHESTTGICMFPILNPPPFSLLVPFLWVIHIHPYLFFCNLALLNAVFGFPSCSVVKNPSTCQCRRLGFNFWVVIFPEEGNHNLLQYSCLGKPMDSYSPWGVKETDMNEWVNEKTTQYCCVQ